MAADERMSIDERRKYLHQMQKRYRKASRKGKRKLLDEMQAVTGQHRKHLTRLMNGSLERQPRRRERGKQYGPDVAAAVAVIAESLG
jgi:phage gp16-like protein